MREGDAEFEFLELVDRVDPDAACGFVVAGVGWGGEEGGDFGFEELDVCECCVGVDEDGHGFPVRARPSDVFDAFEVQAIVAHLQVFAVVDAPEDGEEDANAGHDDGGRHGGLYVIDFDAVADVVGVLEEYEDAAVEEFVDCAA